jgi:hypothetical protein
MNLACSLQVRGELQPPCFYGQTLSCTVPAACTGPPCQEMVQIHAATKSQAAAWNSSDSCQNTAVPNSAYKCCAAEAAFWATQQRIAIT